jgi:hypothetical protein
MIGSAKNGGRLTLLVRNSVTFEPPTVKPALTRTELDLAKLGIAERHRHASNERGGNSVQHYYRTRGNRMISPMLPKDIGFPVSGLVRSTEHPTSEQTSTPARFWYSELDRAWAPATKATKVKSTRMTVDLESAMRRCWT